MINVLLVEDHNIVREGIEQLLSKSKDLCVIGSVRTGKEGLAVAREKHPHVVILDFQLPDANGLEVTRKLLLYRPDIKILILTGNKNETVALQLLEAGAAGYLSKDYGFCEMEQAVRSIHLGQRYISSDMANLLALRKVQPDQKTLFDELSPREMEIALCIANGLTPEKTAEHLHIAKKLFILIVIESLINWE